MNREIGKIQWKWPQTGRWQSHKRSLAAGLFGAWQSSMSQRTTRKSRLTSKLACRMSVLLGMGSALPVYDGETGNKKREDREMKHGCDSTDHQPNPTLGLLRKLGKALPCLEANGQAE